MNEATAKLIQSKIRRWRLALSMSQAELESRCGVSRVSLSYIESGERTPHPATLLKIVIDGFGVTLDEFLEHDPEVAPRKERATGMPMPNLRDWRTHRGLTMKQVADVTGVTPSTISHVERGGNASPRLYAMLLHYLRISAEDLQESPKEPLTLEQRQATPWPQEPMRQTLKNIQVEKDARAKRSAKRAIDKMLHEEKQRIRAATPMPDTEQIMIDENASPDVAKMLESVNFLKGQIRLHHGRAFREDEEFKKKQFTE
ncbi:MAG: helix-turn-helix domain-containing protein [Ktedonobacterales bacterium]